MRAAHWAQRHARSICFLLFLLSLAGLAASFRLPVSLFPQVNFPRVQVTVDAGARPVERMATEVTLPMEESLRAVPGVRQVRSVTSRGSAQISLDFDWNADMLSALLQVQAQTSSMIRDLPAGTTLDVRRMDPTVFPIIAYSLTSESMTPAQLRDLAVFDLRPILSTVTGVSQVGVQGGAVEEYRAIVSPAKLQSFGLTLNDVATALSSANVLTAVGQLEDHDKLYLVITNTQFREMEQIGKTVLRAVADRIIRLEDVATLRSEPAPEFTRVTADGHDAVLLQIYQQPGGNTVQISSDIKARLADGGSHLPAEVKLAKWYDQSDLIVASAHSVRDATIIGTLLAAGVLLLFLRNWKVTLIAALAVPTVLAATVIVLFALGQSFNVMTLGGMAAAVGLIIDDAIVMIEHIVRRMRAGSNMDVARASDEFSKPLTGSSASTIVIHLPPAFLVGIAGAFFAALSLTMAAALCISFAAAWLVIPALAGKLLNGRDELHQTSGAFAARTAALYRTSMQRALAKPWLVVLLIIPLLALGYVAYNHAQRGFMPVMDEGGFVLDYVAPPGASVAETDRLMRQVETILHGVAEIQTYSRRTGLQLGGGLTESNTGDFFVRLKDFPRRPIEDVIDDVRKQCESHVAGVEFEAFQLIEDEINDLTGVPQPIEVKIFAEDEAVLNETAAKVAEVLKEVDILEVKSGVVIAGDALDIRVDRDRAAVEGVDPDFVARAIADATGGRVATQIQRGPKLIGVRVWTPHDSRATEESLSELMIRSPAGKVFPLKRVATIDHDVAQPEVTREDLKRMVSVTGRIEDGNLGAAAERITQALARPGLLPKNAYYRLGGLFEQQQLAFQGLQRVVVAAGALVFLLLLFLYESFRVAAAALFTSVLAIAVVFIALWLTGTALNITSLMGVVMIVGNVTEVAIFYYSEYVSGTEKNASESSRLIEAGVIRSRAILMTSLAAVLALLPLAFGVGHGAAMLRPLAVAIIAGLVAQLPLVLVVFPMLLSLGRLRHRKIASVEKNQFSENGSPGVNHATHAEFQQEARSLNE